MQVEIDEVVSRVTAMGGNGNISEQTMQRIVAAVMDAVEARDRRREQVDEEQSLRNYHQRNQPWTR